MGNILLLDSDISSTCKGMTMKKMIISIGKNKRFLYSPTIVYYAVLLSIYISLTEVIISILTTAFLQYFFWLFSFCFLRELLHCLVI